MHKAVLENNGRSFEAITAVSIVDAICNETVRSFTAMKAKGNVIG